MKMNIILVTFLIGMMIIARLIFGALENNVAKGVVTKSTYQGERVERSSVVLDLMSADGAYTVDAKKYRASLGTVFILGCVMGFFASVMVLSLFYKSTMKMASDEGARLYRSILQGGKVKKSDIK